MSLAVNLLIIALAVYAGYAGYRRGLVVVGLELCSFILATILALATYQSVGAGIKALFRVTWPLANVAGFVTAWVVTEIAFAICIRFLVLARIPHNLHLNRLNRAGGAVLEVAKVMAFTALALVMYLALPLPSGAKDAPRQAYLAARLVDAARRLPFSGSGLASDFTNSLDFFTVTSEPGSDKRINLGFTTTKVTVDQKDEEAMLVLVNHERTTRGLKPLTLNLKARAVARAYSADMFARGYFSHINPEGKSPFDRMKAGGVEYANAGENLALAPTLQQAHDGLMKSPGHRANILSPDFRTVGIGIMDGGPYGIMVTQDFTD